MPDVSVEGGVGNGVIVNVLLVENSIYIGASSGERSYLGEQDRRSR